MNKMVSYIIIFLLNVFIATVSQVMLKKAAMKHYDSVIKEYLNPLVVGAYFIFVVCTLMTVYAYKVIPLSLGPVLEATSYFYVTMFGIKIFHEKMNRKKFLALLLIVAGIVVFAVFG
jgi:multidrug transporter EmrE-like cation transporter